VWEPKKRNTMQGRRRFSALIDAGWKGKCKPKGMQPAGSCFPGDAFVPVFDEVVETFGQVPMRSVREGQQVLVGRGRSGVYTEPVLLEWHSPAENRTKNVEFLRLVHEEGVLDITESHFLLSVEHGMVPAGQLAVGEHVYALPGMLNNQSKFRVDEASFSPSRILARELIIKDGIFAKLTFSGTLVVNGVLASSYTLDSGGAFIPKEPKFVSLVKKIGYNGIHSMIHSLALPLRLIHKYAPASWRQNRFWSPYNANQHGSVASDGLPIYVDVVGRFAWAILQKFL